MTTIAVMQPYFLPYAGYFRLFAAADRVALFDCVQFPRRGWVHRNRLPDASGKLRWLTLPLTRAPQTARIADLRFAPDAAPRLAAQFGRFPTLTCAEHPLATAMAKPDGEVASYLARLLEIACSTLDLPFEVIRTSSLSLGPDLRGTARVLAVAEMLGATRYVNLQGGRALYQPEAFARRGITLRFLDDWKGSTASILHRLLTEPAAHVGAEIRTQSRA